MHTFRVGDSWPLTYYALVDLAGSILKAFEPVRRVPVPGVPPFKAMPVD